MSSINIVRQLVSDAIWNNETISENTKMKACDRIDIRCTSLETARVFITMRRLVVVLMADLTNAIQEEEILCVDDHQANLALVAKGVICSDLIPEPTDDKKIKICVDDHRANLALEAEGVLLSDLTPEPTDYETRDHSEDCTKLGDDLTSTVVNTMRKVEISKFDSADAEETNIDKDAIDSHDQKVSAGGFLASATSADVELPLKVLELGPFFAPSTNV
jgi:hypothetical protein